MQEPWKVRSPSTRPRAGSVLLALVLTYGAWSCAGGNQPDADSAGPSTAVASTAGTSTSDGSVGTTSASATTSAGATGSGGAAASSGSSGMLSTVTTAGNTTAAATSGGGAVGSTTGDSSVGGSGAGGDAATATTSMGGVGGSGGTGSGASDAVPLDPELLASCSGTSPIVCAFDEPDGNYDVTLELGDAVASASSYPLAETLRPVGPELETAAGETLLWTFTVNVREERHDGGQGAPGGVLDLMIAGATPKLSGIGIQPAPDAITVFMAGDSTSCDWHPDNSSALADDERGWVQALSMYFERGVAIANYADSGETAGSFYSKFFPQARDAMKEGDYLFIEFGHNDQKNDADVANYQANLMRYVSDARDRGVIPVILTPISRASASDANPGFAGLDDQAREVAANEDVALIDMSVLTRAYYASVADKAALFVAGDSTHLNESGAVAVAGVAAGAIQESALGLSEFVR